MVIEKPEPDSFQSWAAKGQGQLTQAAAKEMWLDVRKKKKLPWIRDQAQEQVVQNIKNTDAYTSVANASSTQQMSPSVDHIFWCLTDHSLVSLLQTLS